MSTTISTDYQCSSPYVPCPECGTDDALMVSDDGCGDITSECMMCDYKYVVHADGRVEVKSGVFDRGYWKQPRE